jgi:tetratricopeptide (TPR) repeat protein
MIIGNFIFLKQFLYLLVLKSKLYLPLRSFFKSSRNNLTQRAYNNIENSEYHTMAKRKVDQAEAVVVDQKTQTSTSAPFWEVYQKQILYGIGGIAAVLLLWWGYKNLIVEPKQKEAVAAMWKAEMMFEKDSFNLALNNPGVDAQGFLSIIDNFGGTPAGNSAKYYAAVCYLQTGDFDNAIKYMEDYDGKGELLSTMKYGILGDCYSEKQDFSKALSMYEKAISAGDNETLVPIYLKKLGMLNEKQGDKAAALKAYERIRRDYPNPASADWRDIEKYIYRNGGGQQ